MKNSPPRGAASAPEHVQLQPRRHLQREPACSHCLGRTGDPLAQPHADASTPSQGMDPRETARPAAALARVMDLEGHPPPRAISVR